MPTIDATEYERFSYDEATPSMTLEEAEKKASELRKADPSRFHRIEATGDNTFRVDSVSKAEAYEDFLARSFRMLSKFARVARRA
jgi:hypothetical protein